MKNFYEATVIKPTLKLDIVLQVRPVGIIQAQIWINTANWTREISNSEQFRHTVDLTDPIDIQIQIQRTHPEALEVELEIDGISVLPMYQHLANPPICYIDNNSVWTYHIPNFYPWLHEITGQGWII